MSVDLQSLYDPLSTAFDAAGIELSPAEAHGILTGFACAGGGPAASGVALLLQGIAIQPGKPADSDRLRALLKALADLTTAQLDDPEFAFEPLTPGDVSVADAARSLGDWCHGFLTGLAGGGVRDFARLSPESREFVGDIMTIAEAEPTPDATDEDEARALTELVEYLRAGVQLLYDERRGA